MEKTCHGSKPLVTRFRTFHETHSVFVCELFSIFFFQYGGMPITRNTKVYLPKSRRLHPRWLCTNPKYMRACRSQKKPERKKDFEKLPRLVYESHIDKLYRRIRRLHGITITSQTDFHFYYLTLRTKEPEAILEAINHLLHHTSRNIKIWCCFFSSFSMCCIRNPSLDAAILSCSRILHADLGRKRGKRLKFRAVVE